MRTAGGGARRSATVAAGGGACGNVRAVVDTRGAMLLETHLPAVAVHTPPPDVLLGRPFKSQNALTIMFASAVLQALTIHLRQGRGELFDLDTRDAHRLKVGQLAALVREHNGSAGQGFELAVSDALNAGVPGVVEPVRYALARIGVPMAQPRSVVMGLEKAADPAALARMVTAAVGDRRLRVGRRGGQPLAGRAVTRLVEAGTAIRAERGALARADLLVYDDAGISAVTASVKIGSSFAIPPEPPRLWIISGRGDWLRANLPANCAVAPVGDAILDAYMRAYRATVSALRAGDRGRPIGPSLIAQVLQRRWLQSVSSAYEELADRARELGGGYGMDLDVPGLSGETLEIVSAEVPDEFAGYEESDGDGGITVMHRPQFVVPHRQFFRAAA